MDKNVALVRGEDAKFRVYGYDPREFPGESDKTDAPTEFEVSAGSLRPYRQDFFDRVE